MIAKETTSIPVPMENVRRRLERWRSTRVYRRSHIPLALWAAAVTWRAGMVCTPRLARFVWTTRGLRPDLDRQNRSV